MESRSQTQTAQSQTVVALAALAHETRLAAFRMLVQAGPEGVAAGVLSDRLGIPSPTLSFHLKDLLAAGLVTSRREGRFVLYAPDLERMAGLIAYLTHDCCAGRACEPLAAIDMTARC